jgi:hypothetical protein
VSTTFAKAMFFLALAFAATGASARSDGPSRHAHDPVPEGVAVPAWSELTPGQQEKLAPLRDRWDQMPASRRVHALERMERRARWDAMTPEQRDRLRHGARNFRDLPPELRENMRESMQVVRQLPEDQRRELKERWRAMDPEQRRRWLEAGGPGLAPPPEG